MICEKQIEWLPFMQVGPSGTFYFIYHPKVAIANHDFDCRFNDRSTIGRCPGTHIPFSHIHHNLNISSHAVDWLGHSIYVTDSVDSPVTDRRLSWHHGIIISIHTSRSLRPDRLFSPSSGPKFQRPFSIWIRWCLNFERPAHRSHFTRNMFLIRFRILVFGALVVINFRYNLDTFKA